jgi:GNAT superfamily N-acetyltransferase
MSPRVWKAGPEDAHEVVRLMLAFRSWYGKPTSPEVEAQFADVIKQIVVRDDAEYLLACGDDGRPAGVAQIRYRLSVWTGSEDCWIEDVYVDEAARGRGIGRALVADALRRARERGCGRAELDVDTVNAPARALYGSLGFRDKSEGGSLLLQCPLT